MNYDEAVPLFKEAIDKAVDAAREADDAQEARDRRGGYIDPDTSVRRAQAWATIAQAITLEQIHQYGAGA